MEMRGIDKGFLKKTKVSEYLLRRRENAFDLKWVWHPNTIEVILTDEV